MSELSPERKEAMKRRILAAIEDRREAEACFTERYNQDVARRVREESGLEYTPGQVAEIRDRALAKIRKQMEEAGFDAPGDDVALMARLRREFQAMGDGQAVLTRSERLHVWKWNTRSVRLARNLAMRAGLFLLRRGRRLLRWSGGRCSWCGRDCGMSSSCSRKGLRCDGLGYNCAEMPMEG